MNKMRILLTGGSGMVGRNILDFNDGRFDFISPGSSELNLLDYGQVNSYLKEVNPELVIHAAGRVGGIQANMAQPVSFLVENLEMGKNIILASKELNIKRLINLSSSCMYPRNAKNPLSEDLILKGQLEPTNEGYALAKIFSTRLCEYINKENPDFEYKTIIPCNLYGKYDKFDPKHSHMIPAVIRKIHEAKVRGLEKIDIWGDGTARREFMYSGDLADFIFFAISNFNDLPQNINVGLGYDYSINEYYEMVADVVQFEGKFEHDLSKPTGMKQKLIDNSEINRLNWRHKTSLREGIIKTYKYFLEEKYNGVQVS